MKIIALIGMLILTTCQAFGGWFDFMKSDKPAERKPAAAAPAAKPKNIDKKKLYTVICQCFVGSERIQHGNSQEAVEHDNNIRQVTRDMFTSLMKEHLPGMDMNCHVGPDYDYNSVAKSRRDCVRGYKKYGSDEELKEAGEDLTS